LGPEASSGRCNGRPLRILARPAELVAHDFSRERGGPESSRHLALNQVDKATSVKLAGSCRTSPMRGAYRWPLPGSVIFHTCGVVALSDPVQRRKAELRRLPDKWWSVPTRKRATAGMPKSAAICLSTGPERAAVDRVSQNSLRPDPPISYCLNQIWRAFATRQRCACVG
jgi:hypothetical protein